jgi:transposase
MMGITEEKTSKMFYVLQLNQKIPKDHPLRKLKRVLKLDFMYESLKEKYGVNGNVSVPPPVLMKMMLLLVLYNVRSERELTRDIPLRLDWMWFLGYDIDETPPNHSVLSKARIRWGEKLFKELFQRILIQAVESGLVDGDKLFADSSLVDADASRNSVKRLSNMKVLDTAYEELVNRLEENELPDKEEVIEDGENQREEEKKKGGYKRVNDSHKSTTDGDATLAKDKNGTKLRYKVHRSVDEKCEIITACETTTGIINEAVVLEGLIEKQKEVLGKSPKIVVADSKYGTQENLINLQNQGIKAHIRDLSKTQENGGIRKDIFSKEEFNYNKEGDYYECPTGEKLNKRTYNLSRGWYEYKASKDKCMECHLRSSCTNDKNGRTLKRHKDEEILEKAKLEANSAESARDLKKRQHLMERSFGTGTRYGFKRARWRGLSRVSIQQYLVSIVQNLLKIAKYGWDDCEENKGVQVIWGEQKGNSYLFVFIFTVSRCIKRFFSNFSLKVAVS